MRSGYVGIQGCGALGPQDIRVCAFGFRVRVVGLGLRLLVMTVFRCSIEFSVQVDKLVSFQKVNGSFSIVAL